jgi:hypothetical protein
MARVDNAVVQQIDTKNVTARGRLTQTYTFKANGAWFRTNFKDHGLVVGDVVTFSYEVGKYGNDVDIATLQKIGSAPAGAVPAVPASSAPARPAVSRAGTFPIPPLDGQRSIVRQNALTNARELVVARIADFKDAPDAEVAAHIIEVARAFEAYSCGDEELAAVMAEQESAA